MLHEYKTESGKRAFSTTRHGGVSTDNYASFNANMYCGDNPDHVAHNRMLLCERLGIKDNSLIIPHQTHHTRTLIVDNAFLQLPENERKERLEGIDAVSTNLEGVCVCVSTADCIPILLYDEKSKGISAIHAGWRGTVARIVEENIKVLVSTYNINPENLHAIIGPGISLDAFEVGDEVYDAFDKAGFDMTLIAQRQSKWHIDLPLCNKLQLIDIGIKESNITMSGICTFNNEHDFFSARRLGINSGRILNGIINP